jgi:signal transduction histidine kinase
VKEAYVQTVPVSLQPTVVHLLFRLSGLIIWLAYAPLAWFNSFAGHPQVGVQDLETSAFFVWLIAYLMFGLTLLRLSICKDDRESFRFRVSFISLNTLTVLVMSWILPWSGGFGGLLIMPISMIALLFPSRIAFAWLVAQNVVFAGVLAWQGVNPLSILVVSFFLIQILTLLFVRMTINEAKGREEISRINQELLSSRNLLAEASRQQERLRIAQDLHDLMGHQLTTLHLNLETLSRHPLGPEAQQVLHRSQLTVKALFEDVRSSVSALRDDEPKDFEQAVQNLLSPLPGVEIHLSVQGPLRLEHPEVTKTGLRCLQEILTNTLRHANAQNIWVLLKSSPDGLLIQARDDGQGTPAIQTGHGLTGMRERVEALGGEVHVSSKKGEGFVVQVHIPRVAQATPSVI